MAASTQTVRNVVADTRRLAFPELGILLHKSFKGEAQSYAVACRIAAQEPEVEPDAESPDEPSGRAWRALNQRPKAKKAGNHGET
jgi:hypothetical protein